MERLGTSLGKELGRLGPAGDADLAAIVASWPAAVGEENARRAWPARIGRDGALRVHTADAVWANQLTLLGPQILAVLRERLGSAAPSTIRFAAGPLPAPAEVESARRPRPVVADPDEVEQAAALTTGIADGELRELVARAAAASLARARSSRRF
jgi:predicted nucleic acid-binding Zn ribbon protein